LITVYNIKKTQKYEKTLEIDYIKNPIAIYRDRYVFAFLKEYPNAAHVEIYDISEQKLIGKIPL
jgi:hypothetical protein